MGFPRLAVFYWITTLNNTHTHTRAHTHRKRKKINTALCSAYGEHSKYRYLSFLLSKNAISIYLNSSLMCSDQHVKYWIPRGFPLTSSLQLDYHVKQYIHTWYSAYLLNYITKRLRVRTFSFCVFKTLLQNCKVTEFLSFNDASFFKHSLSDNKYTSW